ncbi:YybH family protein [Dyadobacter arcticus]|uniref:SnoaL-like domain-containing protein n=1 Tax=Dyadobacter arcticus TaxID=1078754 RepID=A0ABX0UK49_9BACT|nr:nuclear transport factor 2 family protein [Dyadobacter arcticus]NIJ53378.1 hypothetical protein [Dyadobacter arcticus]
MKRNISVFILLILLASSFKYRTKSRETDQKLITAGYPSQVISPKEDKSISFDATVLKLQQAHQEFVKGNPEPLKALWAHNDEVTVFDGIANQEFKGWKAVESSLDNAFGDHNNYNYSFSKIASNQGDDQAYLLQEEHYKQSDGKAVDLHVTIVFRKENNVWKIYHRHEDNLAGINQSDVSTK